MFLDHEVTISNNASVALNLLREKNDSFDAVISSDVHMLNMDGYYKFFQHVDQEFNLPIILVCVDGLSSSVMEDIRHWACHNLIKPNHHDDIRNRKNDNKEQEVSGVLESNDDPNNKLGNNSSDDGVEYTSFVIDANEGVIVKDKRKRSISSEGDGAAESRDDNHHPILATKKPRFRWTLGRKQQFLNVVERLGNKATPKKILELMNIPGLTREHVASHLQKYKLKRKSDETQQNGMLNGTVQSNNKLGASGRFSSMQGLPNADGSCHNVSPQTQAGLHHAGNTRRSRRENHSNNASSPSQASYGGTTIAAAPAPKYDSRNFAAAYNNNNCYFPSYHALMALDDASPSSGYVGWEWPSTTSPCRFDSWQGLFQDNDSDELMNIMAMQQQQNLLQEYPHQQNIPYYEHDLIYASSDLFSNNNKNIQPSSYLMASQSQSQPYETFQATISPVNYNFGGRNNSLLEQSTFSPQLNNSSSSSNFTELCGYSAPPILATHPTFRSGIQQQQQLHDGVIRPFHHGLPHLSDALVVPHDSGSSDIGSSFHHQGGQVESQ